MFIRTIFLILITICLGATPAFSDPKEKAAAGSPDYDILIIPTDEFPLERSKGLLAAIAKETGLRIRITLPLGTREWKAYPDRLQYNPEIVNLLALPVIERIRPNYGGRTYVILTARDIAPADNSAKFAFAWNDHDKKVSVVSIASMLRDERGEGVPQVVVDLRLRKMLLRTIALQFYEMQRSADINDVTYSPMLSIDELDRMGTTLKKPR